MKTVYILLAILSCQTNTKQLPVHNETINFRRALKEKKEISHKILPSQVQTFTNNDMLKSVTVKQYYRSCLAWKNKKLPMIFKDPPFVLAQANTSCMTSNGISSGYKLTTKLITIGFPCTAGGGKIEAIGNIWNPKVLKFNLPIDCPMLAQNKIKEAIRSSINMSFAPFKLIAYNPLAIKYWQLPSIAQSDLGFKVNIVTAANQKILWQHIQEKKPIDIILYGREHSWAKNKQLYKVAAKIMPENAKNFSLKIDNIKILNNNEILSLKKLCLQQQNHILCERL